MLVGITPLQVPLKPGFLLLVWLEEKKFIWNFSMFCFYLFSIRSNLLVWLWPLVGRFNLNLWGSYILTFCMMIWSFTWLLIQLLYVQLCINLFLIIVCLEYGAITRNHHKLILFCVIFIFDIFNHWVISPPEIICMYQSMWNTVYVLNMVYLNLGVMYFYHQFYFISSFHKCLVSQLVY